MAEWGPADLAEVTAFHAPLWVDWKRAAMLQRYGRCPSNLLVPIEELFTTLRPSLARLFTSGYNLTDVGAMFGLSRERIRQIANKLGLDRLSRRTPPRIWDGKQFRPLTVEEERAISAVPTIERPSLQELFWNQVDIRGDNDCWEWQGRRTPWGYGYNGRYAHRRSYLWTYGSIDLPCICHSCDNPPCVNPAHLFEGTYSDNTQDSIAKGRWGIHKWLGVKRSHCKWGHELNPENRNPSGHCRECVRRRSREYKERQRRIA